MLRDAQGRPGGRYPPGVSGNWATSIERLLRFVANLQGFDSFCVCVCVGRNFLLLYLIIRIVEGFFEYSPVETDLSSCVCVCVCVSGLLGGGGGGKWPEIRADLTHSRMAPWEFYMSDVVDVAIIKFTATSATAATVDVLLLFRFASDDGAECFARTTEENLERLHQLYP